MSVGEILNTAPGPSLMRGHLKKTIREGVNEMVAIENLNNNKIKREKHNSSRTFPYAKKYFFSPPREQNEGFHTFSYL